MTSTKGISGVAVGVLATGAILVWSGINNQDLLTSFRALAMGNPIPTGEQKASAFRPGNKDDLIPKGGTALGARILSIAASYEGHPYIFGGGHGTVCPDSGMDCSGYVSCVLNKAGVMKGTLTTDGFRNWGLGVKFNERQPGDLVVWIGGPGGGHMGIVIDGNTMWHSPCTGCKGVSKAIYGKTRTGRTTNVRRPKGSL